MVTICTRLKNEPTVRKISEDYKAVYYAAGEHPMRVSSEPMANLEELIQSVNILNLSLSERLG
jgi:TatD DNase family protein